MGLTKFLLLSEPDWERLKEIDYGLLERLYIKYRREKVLYEPVCGVLLCAGASSERNLRSILEFERSRLRDEKTIAKTFDLPVRDVMGTVIRAIVERLGFEDSISVSKDNRALVMDISVAVAFGLDPDETAVIERGLIVTDVEKGYDAVLNAYLNALRNTIAENRDEILRACSPLENVKKLVETYFREVSERKGVKVKGLPPCVQQILDGNVEPGSRNTALVSMINILKFLRERFNYDVSDGEIEEMVRKANSNFPEPLPEREVNSIIKYHVHTYRDRIYNGCSMIRREAPELCPYGDSKECWRKLISGKSPHYKAGKKEYKRRKRRTGR